MNRQSWMLPLSVLMGALVVGGASLAAAEIRDAAGFFSADAVSAAREKLNLAQQQAHHGVTIETFATLPDGRATAVEKMAPAEKARFFSDWLKQQAKREHAEGIFVLITKTPGHVEVGISGKLQAAGYSPASKKALVDTFLTAFRAKEFDRGLNDAVTLIEQDYAKLTANPSTRPVSPAAPAKAPVVPAPLREAQDVPFAQRLSLVSIVMIVAAVVVGLMIISALMRAMTGALGGGVGGGGGFGSGLMGGLLGGLAGSWLYDSFSHSSNSAHAGESTHTDSGGSFNSSSDDTWSTSGGDFGGSDFSGGGDFGGGGDF